MISRFFIHRPIFAAVLSILVTLTGWIALRSLPIAQYPQITPPAVQVAISYPGANAQVVADTVAAPIEQQVNGVQGMLYMSSQMGNDGSYSLTVTFDLGTNLNTALVMVQNRVTLALPQLPTAVQKQGITIKKKTPDILLVVNFFSPDGRYDDIYLSNYATINVRDELFRLEGVSDINTLGQRDYSIRVWLDPQKVASLGMTAMEVADAIRSQNLEAPAGQVGQPPTTEGYPFQLPIETLGRLSKPEQFGDIVVKVGRGAQVNAAPPPLVLSTPPPTTSAPVRIGSGSLGSDLTLKSDSTGGGVPAAQLVLERILPSPACRFPKTSAVPLLPSLPAVATLAHRRRSLQVSFVSAMWPELTWAPELQPDLYLQWQAVRRTRYLPTSRNERSGRGRARPRQNGGVEDALSGWSGLRHRLRHDAVHPRIG